MHLLLCTGNAHKLDELRALLPGCTVEGLAPGEASQLPPETGDTFLDNARIKARGGLALHPGFAGWSLADDSGLCVDALDGAPGVRSARFAGEQATDADNNALLLERLEGIASRSARFVCVLVAAHPDGRELVAEGVVEGTIVDAPRGTTGFGYDPLFAPEGERRTFGELGPDVKARLSHRARAAARMHDLLMRPGPAR